jgi:hypothetical protein
MDSACPACGGSGQTAERCPKCHGSRKQSRVILFWRLTMMCGGCYAHAVGVATGRVPCSKCRGTGSKYA